MSHTVMFYCVEPITEKWENNSEMALTVEISQTRAKADNRLQKIVFLF